MRISVAGTCAAFYDAASRWLWPAVAVVELMNALDWDTTLVGVGHLGLPERASTSAWLIAHLGLFWGMTVLHGTAALGFLGLGLLTARMLRWPHYRGLVGVAGATVAFAYSGLLLGQTVLGNVSVIVDALRR